MSCRICTHQLEKIISFGKMPIANGFLAPSQFKDEYFFELATAFCSHCKMFQLINQPDPKMMFHENYAFFSSSSQKMAEHFEKMAEGFLDEFLPQPADSFVIELGSNDGIMLRHFSSRRIKHLGVEPSVNVAQVARQNGVDTISEFFGEEIAQKIKEEHGKADIISASNVMCHIPDLGSVGRGVDLLLKDGGIFVFEDPYLGSMIQKTSYDQIYDEHVYIFSVQSVSNAFKPYGLEVFHVAPQTTHGGSMRYYLARKGAYPKKASVEKQLEIESKLGLHQIEPYKQFALNCEKSKKDLVALLQKLKKEGNRVVGYAATSKSTTVLNYCGIGPDLVEYICDTTPLKQNKFSPGMHIPIKAYEEFQKDNPDYAILFAWNHAQEIFSKEKDFESGGGKWIVFVPEVQVLE
jgi:methylation protein EvaC